MMLFRPVNSSIISSVENTCRNSSVVNSYHLRASSLSFTEALGTDLAFSICAAIRCSASSRGMVRKGRGFSFFIVSSYFDSPMARVRRGWGAEGLERGSRQSSNKSFKNAQSISRPVSAVLDALSKNITFFWLSTNSNTILVIYQVLMPSYCILRRLPRWDTRSQVFLVNRWR